MRAYAHFAKKPPVKKVQTVAEPHSPSLYGESISASSTTPLGCTTVSATLVIDYPPRHNQYTIIQEDCQCRKIKILQDILYRLRGLCRRHETKGNKKPPVQKVQTVAEPHSPSLYGESISALLTTSLGCTQSCHNFGSLNSPRHNQYTIIQENCQCTKIKILRETVRTETLPQSVVGLTTN